MQLILGTATSSAAATAMQTTTMVGSADMIF